MDLHGGVEGAQNRLERRSCDQPPVIERVIQRTDAERVARQEKTPPRRIPEGEGEVADQVPGAVFGPAVVGGEHDLGIRHCALVQAAEHGAELLAVVEAQVGADPETVLTVDRLTLLDLFGRSPEMNVNETDRALAPGISAIGSTASDPLSQHREVRGLNRGPIPEDDGSESAHRLMLPDPGLVGL